MAPEIKKNLEGELLHVTPIGQEGDAVRTMLEINVTRFGRKAKNPETVKQLEKVYIKNAARVTGRSSEEIEKDLKDGKTISWGHDWNELK